MMRHSRRYSVTTDPRLIWDRLSIDYREKGRPNIKYLYLYLDLYSQLYICPCLRGVLASLLSIDIL